jgi:hypothetical protein
MPENDLPEYQKCACRCCGEHIEFPVHGFGKKINCPHCGQATRLGEKTLENASSSQPPSSDLIKPNFPPDLVLTGICPNCSMRVRKSHWGYLGNVELIHKCEECGDDFDVYPVGEITRFVCPRCKRDVSEAATSCCHCRTRLVPSRCPNCSSTDLLVVTPRKPILFAPVSFFGLLLSAASSALADKMFTDYYRCRSCGREWK